MNIQEIRNLTKNAQVKRAAAASAEKLKTRKQNKEAKQKLLKQAHDLSFFITEITQAAKSGMNKYSISLGGDEDDFYTIQQMKCIKQKLADFNPTFTRDQHETCSYNWEGTSIDGSERTYYAMTVHFTW